MAKLIENKWFACAVILISALMRLIFLDADTSIFKASEDVLDEFWWVSAALYKINFGVFPTEYQAGPLAAGPLYSFLIYGWFQCFGIQLFSLRFLAWFSSLLVILFSYFLIKKSNAKTAFWLAIALSFLHSFIIYSRIAQVEMLQLALLMFSFLLLKAEKHLAYFAAGLVLGVALFLKLSFIIAIPALYLSFLMMNRSRINFRGIFLITAGLLSIVLPFILLFFIPNAAIHEAYFQAFSNGIYSINELVHPLGIPFRLMFLYEHNLFYDPSFFILCILLFSKVFISQMDELSTAPISNSFKWVLWFSVFYFIFLLFTDFNERRMLLLLPGLVVALFTPIKKKTINVIRLALCYIFSLSLIPIIKNNLGNVIFINIGSDILNPYAFFIIVHLLVFSATVYFIKIKRKLDHPAIKFFGIFFMLFWFYLVIKSQIIHWVPFSDAIIFVAVFFFMAVLIFLGQGFSRTKHLAMSTAFAIAFLMHLGNIIYPSFSTQIALLETRNYNEYGAIIAGDNSIYLTAFASKIKPLAFTGDYKANADVLLKQFKMFRPERYMIQLENGEEGLKQIDEEILEISKRANCEFEFIDYMGLLPHFGRFRKEILVYKVTYLD